MTVKKCVRFGRSILLTMLLLACAGSLLDASPSRAQAPSASPSPHATPASGDDRRFGLTVSQRQSVFREISAAEERAEKQAAEQFRATPESEGQLAMTQRLKSQYMAEIAKQHELTTKQLTEIGAEGFEQSWPTELP
jgi:hypothetical protein